MKRTMLVLVGMFWAGCGNRSSAGGDNNAVATITISGLAFSPANLTVMPGTTVTVQNKDSFSHSVTSQNTPGAFTPGSVGGVQFDTGVFSGTKTFSIPSSAPMGTVIPYYCQVHKAMMASSGQITVGPASSGDGGTTNPPGY